MMSKNISLLTISLKLLAVFPSIVLEMQIYQAIAVSATMQCYRVHELSFYQ
jgi:hypothetical protein